MLILTFVVAMIMNLGTNFLLGKISFVSDSVTSILQLALSLDYAVIFCNRYKEEHQTLPIREAVIVSLSKAIPEIGASSLTTVGGLVAMMFMQMCIRDRYRGKESMTLQEFFQENPGGALAFSGGVDSAYLCLLYTSRCV